MVYPNYERIYKLNGTIQMINDIFAADDEVVRETDCLPASPSGMWNESPAVHFKGEFISGEKVSKEFKQEIKSRLNLRASDEEVFDCTFCPTPSTHRRYVRVHMMKNC